MAGFDNEVMFSSGERLEEVTALSQLLLQEAATDVGRVSYVGSPEGVISANPSSMSHNPMTGDIYYKVSGVGNTGWSLLSVGNIATANYIVDPLGVLSNYTTIASAIAAASLAGGGTIAIKPGAYTENLTLGAGINLCTFTSEAVTDRVIIIGKCTATFAGSASYAGIEFRTNGDYCLELTGSNATTLWFDSCKILANNNTAMNINNTNAALRFTTSILNSNSNNLLFTITSVSGIDFRYSTLNSGTAVNTIADGPLNFFNCRCQSVSITTSATGYVNSLNTNWDNSLANLISLTLAGTGYNLFHNSQSFNGTAKSITAGAGTSLEACNSVFTSSNADVIDGAGTIYMANLSFPGSSSTVSVTTQNSLNAGINPLFGGTSNVKVPIGTTAQRPSSPAAGMIRGNSDLLAAEYYDGTSWNQIRLSKWTEVTGTSQNMAVNNGYIANNAALVTCTLPATASVGDAVRVVGKGAGLWKIGQNAGQTIRFLGSSTTTGAGGSVTATTQYQSIELICITANTDWEIQTLTGSLTIV